MKAVLSENNVRFQFADISTSMVALKSYLLLRDTSDAYKDIRGTRSVGIPLLVVDNEPYIVEDEEHAKKLIADLQLAE